jgi:hypothetical protein
MAVAFRGRYQLINGDRTAFDLSSQSCYVPQPGLDIRPGSRLTHQAIHHFTVEAAAMGLGAFLKPRQQPIVHVVQGEGGHRARPPG